MENLIKTASLVADKISNEAPFYNHFGLIICADNAEGKTTFIKKIIEKAKDNADYPLYYIDPQNRCVCNLDNTAITKPLGKMSIKRILENRILPVNFTFKDVFERGTDGPAVAYNAIRADIDKYSTLFWDFFAITLRDDSDGINFDVPQIKVNDRAELYEVSSSESARMRILLEVEFAVSNGAKVIIIDEFNEYLSDTTTYKFINRLHEVYTDTRFIVSMHSLSALLNINDFDVAAICDERKSTVDDNLVRFLDSNTITKIGQIEKLKEIFGEVRVCDQFNELVSRVVETGDIRDSDVELIKNTDRHKLTGREKVLYDYAKRIINSDC